LTIFSTVEVCPSDESGSLPDSLLTHFDAPFPQTLTGLRLEPCRTDLDRTHQRGVKARWPSTSIVAIQWMLAINVGFAYFGKGEGRDDTTTRKG